MDTRVSIHWWLKPLFGFPPRSKDSWLPPVTFYSLWQNQCISMGIFGAVLLAGFLAADLYIQSAEADTPA
ncbi:MAG: cysteine dioxygenase family protein [Cyanomargarita calcarea GSE-NOS-MK-12-04C]|jgi:hypothetical protein|uniref:Cysteine dioxygenase family protein n=1 Tax=Cyanomargarita calcarea GSE-NOS-MK-12-04C TaxID=2839659 RepID=A0A951QJ75_9CYAN|nr:cysteine dioxygenase family protein [Cyanomargarita calcarea GSE-NOS-MK-12-04C]